jgi:hypothetical protein
MDCSAALSGQKTEDGLLPTFQNGLCREGLLHIPQQRPKRSARNQRALILSQPSEHRNVEA